jgi:hypothetical protein
MPPCLCPRSAYGKQRAFLPLSAMASLKSLAFLLLAISITLLPGWSAEP